MYQISDFGEFIRCWVRDCLPEIPSISIISSKESDCFSAYFVYVLSKSSSTDFMYSSTTFLGVSSENLAGLKELALNWEMVRFSNPEKIQEFPESYWRY